MSSVNLTGRPSVCSSKPLINMSKRTGQGRTLRHTTITFPSGWHVELAFLDMTLQLLMKSPDCTCIYPIFLHIIHKALLRNTARFLAEIPHTVCTASSTYQISKSMYYSVHPVSNDRISLQASISRRDHLSVPRTCTPRKHWALSRGSASHSLVARPRRHTPGIKMATGNEGLSPNSPCNAPEVHLSVSDRDHEPTSKTNRRDGKIWVASLGHTDSWSWSWTLLHPNYRTRENVKDSDAISSEKTEQSGGVGVGGLLTLYLHLYNQLFHTYAPRHIWNIYIYKTMYVCTHVYPTVTQLEAIPYLDKQSIIRSLFP